MKKIIALVISLTFLTSVAGFASNISPKEILKSSAAESLEITSSEKQIKMNLSFDLDEKVVETLGPFESILKNIFIDIHAKSSTKNSLKLQTSWTATLSGMSYEGELYLTDNVMAMKLPMVEPYIVEKFNTYNSGFSQNHSEAMQQSSKNLNFMAIDLIRSNEIEMEEDVIISVNEKNVNVNTIKINLTSYRVKQILSKLLMTDEYMTTVLMQSIMQGIEKDQEIQNNAVVIENVGHRSGLVESWNEISKYMFVDQCELIFSISQSNQLVASNIKMSIVLHDPSTDQTSKVKFNIDTSTFNINNVNDIEFPELNENNSISAEEL